ncbi:MAG: glycosyltransferase, partial [Solirubrobacteraceae bacterium]
MAKSLPRRIVAVTGVIDPREGELVTLRMLTALRTRGWEVTLTSPAEGALRDAALLEGFRWVPLALGGRAPGQGITAISSWPLIRWLARRTGIVHLGGSTAARLLPALVGVRGRRVLHIHEPVERVPRFWRLADVVLTPSRAVADALAPLTAHAVGVPVNPDPPAMPAPWAGTGGPV